MKSNFPVLGIVVKTSEYRLFTIPGVNTEEIKWSGFALVHIVVHM